MRIASLALQHLGDSVPACCGLQVFNSMMVTPVAKQGIARNTGNMYALLLREFDSVRRHFDAIRKTPPVSAVTPALGLRANMASGLLIRLEKVWNFLQVSRPSDLHV